MKIVKFSAGYCQPCKQLQTTLNEIEHLPNLEHIDVEKDYRTAMEFGVRSVPTMTLLDENNTEIRRVSGAISKEKILEFIA